MKKFLEIKSKGKIDVQAFSLIGASSKRNDATKIGMYGSGNKYAISTLLRKGIEFYVFSGKDEIKFTTRDQKFRDQNFKVILINGNETSLTTTMGGNDWDTAFAPIREIYSNAMDEDTDAEINEIEVLDPEEDYTTFYIDMTPEVEHFYKNVGLYFCTKNDSVIFSNSLGSIYRNTDFGKNTRIFRKGILAFESTDKSIFHYNFDDIDINESRVIKYQFQLYNRIAAILKMCNSESTINTLILELSGANAGYYEHKADFELGIPFSEAWKNICIDKKFAPVEFASMFNEEEMKGRITLPINLLKNLKLQFEEIDILGLNDSSKGTGVNYVIVKPKENFVNKVIDAVGKLLETDYADRWDNPEIEYVQFLDKNTLGQAVENKILLSTKLDVYSVDEIAKIIIEENEHNITGFEDETRIFQNHLFNLYYNQLITK